MTAREAPGRVLKVELDEGHRKRKVMDPPVAYASIGCRLGGGPWAVTSMVGRYNKAMLTKHQRLRAHAAVGLSTQWFHHELSHFHSLAEFTERALEEEQAEFQAWFNARDSGLDTQRTGGLFLYLDDASELKHVYPALFRGALVVAIVSLFEAFLARQARAAGVWCGCPAETNRLRGLNRQLDFLETHAAVRLPKQSDYWQGMRTIEKVRHLLVHSQGRLPEADVALRDLLEHQGFSIDGQDQIQVPRAAIEWVAETLGTLAGEIDDAIRDAIGAPN